VLKRTIPSPPSDGSEPAAYDQYFALGPTLNEVNEF